ncbi:MAG: hypothetical protein GY832_40735 [Chloroflexi bacterium]|nr:hypothetical protein [Chloroflexota bacterium]
MDLQLTPDDVAALETRTEGWIAGLQLAALSLRGRDDASSFIQTLKGSNRFILDYLVEEILHQQAPDIQDFLLQTSILERMCGPLCDAVWASSTKRSQSVLEQLEGANLFIVPLDDHREWYRYHHLFAEFLRTRLHQADVELEPALHQRAAAWYEQHDLSAEALPTCSRPRTMITLCA